MVLTFGKLVQLQTLNLKSLLLKKQVFLVLYFYAIIKVF